METTADFLQAGARCLITIVGLMVLFIGLGRLAGRYGRSNRRILNKAFEIAQRVGAFLEDGLKQAILLAIRLVQRVLAAYGTMSEGAWRLGAFTAKTSRQLAAFLVAFFGGVLADLRALGRGLQRAATYLGRGVRWLTMPLVFLGRLTQRALRWVAEQLSKLGRWLVKLLRGLLIQLIALGRFIGLILRWIGLSLMKMGRYFIQLLRQLLIPVARFGRFIRLLLEAVGRGLWRLLLSTFQLIGRGLRWLGRQTARLLRLLLIPIIGLGRLILSLLRLFGRGLNTALRYAADASRRLLFSAAILGRFIGLMLQALGRGLWRLFVSAMRLVGRGLQWLARQTARLLRLLLIPIIGLGRLILSLLRLFGRGLNTALRYAADASRRLLFSAAILGRFVGLLLRAFGRGLWRLFVSAVRLVGRGLQWLARQTARLLRLLLIPLIALGRFILSLFRLLGRGGSAVTRYVAVALRRLLAYAAILGRFIGLMLQALSRGLWRLLLSAVRLIGRGLQWLGKQTARLLRLLLIPLIGLGHLILSLFRLLGRGASYLLEWFVAVVRRFVGLLLKGFTHLLQGTLHWSSRGIARLAQLITKVVVRLKGPTIRLGKWILSILFTFGSALKAVLAYAWQLLHRLSILVLGLGRWLGHRLMAAGRIVLSLLMSIVELILIPITGLWRLLKLTLRTAGHALQRLGAYFLQLILWLSRPFARLGRQVQYAYQFLGNEVRQLIGEQNTRRLSTVLSSLFVVSLIFGGVVLDKRLTTVYIEIWTNDTKASWVQAVTETFNEKGLKTRSGKTIIVNVEQRDSGDFPVEIEAMLEEKKNGPTIISPGTIAWVSAADAIWQKSKGQPLVPEECPSLAYAPIGFGMWQSMAKAMGYPDTPIGWHDIVDLAADPQGWARYGHPEWGQFKFGHTDPNSSNTGLTAMTSFVYATLGQTSGLAPDLVRSPQVAAAFAQLELITYHYGSSTRSLNVSTAARGKAYLHAVASSENSILATDYFQHDILDEPLVFIFPKEGAFWSENPFCVVDAPWVTADKREAAGLYREYLLSREAQTETVKGWLRPVNLAYLPRTLPDEWQYTDPSITIEDVPPLETDASGDISMAVQEIFNRAKKKATTILVLDTSASMRGDKIRMAKEGLIRFLQQLDDEDEVMLYRFDDSVETVQPLAPAGSIVDSLTQEIKTMRLPILARTSLHDAVCQAKAAAEAAKLEDEANEEKRLYGIVLLSDGEDTTSSASESEMFAECLPQSESADVVKVFTIAYGEDAVVDLLDRIAERTNGRAFVADPENIEEVYDAISFEQ